MSMRLRAGFDQALLADEPMVALRKLVQQLLAEGYTREMLVAALEGFRSQLQAQEREPDEDVVLDVLDFLQGWSSPHMNL